MSDEKERRRIIMSISVFTHTSFEVRMKEVEIEQLQDDLIAAHKKIEILESAMHRMWPGGDRNGRQQVL